MTEAHHDALISILLAAARTGLPAEAIAAEALRRHEQIPVFVQPDPPGWRPIRFQADPRSRVPEFEETFPDDVYDVMLTDRILLTPDVLREVLATGKLHRVTIDGETICSVREEVGYTAWSIDIDGTAEVEADCAVTRSYLETYVLCEAQRVPLEAMLVPRSALDLLHPQIAPPAAASLNRGRVPPVERPPGEPLRADALYDREEAAAILRVTSRTINRWVKNGTIASSKVGGRRLIKGAEILARLEDPAPPEAD